MAGRRVSSATWVYVLFWSKRVAEIDTMDSWPDGGSKPFYIRKKKSVGGTCIHQAEWLHQIFLKLKLQINIQSHKKQTVCGISAELYQYIFSNFYRSVLTHIKAEQILNKVSMSPGVHETNVQISSSMLKPKLIKSLKKAFCFKE